MARGKSWQHVSHGAADMDADAPQLLAQAQRVLARVRTSGAIMSGAGSLIADVAVIEKRIADYLEPTANELPPPTPEEIEAEPEAGVKRQGRPRKAQAATSA